MYYKLVSLFLSIHFLFHISVGSVEETLIMNMENVEAIPIHFRTTLDSLHFNDVEELNTSGLVELRASGSGQFSEKGLQSILKKIGHPNQLMIIDLRQESHGFINGSAVSWYAPRNWGNLGRTTSQIEQLEYKLLQAILKDKKATIYNVIKKNDEGMISEQTPLSVTVDSVAVEKEVVSSMRLNYHRIPVTDHMKPSNEAVDHFIELIRKLSKGTWIHFHCAAGDGRTTTFMAMYDIMYNAKKINLESILNRQWLLGGINLTHMPNIDSWKYDLAVERAVFLKRFYEYCQLYGNTFKPTWSEYMKKKSQEEKDTRPRIGK